MRKEKVRVLAGGSRGCRQRCAEDGAVVCGGDARGRGNTFVGTLRVCDFHSLLHGVTLPGCHTNFQNAGLFCGHRTISFFLFFIYFY